MVRSIIEQNDVLKALCKITKNKIEVPATNSIMRVLSRDAGISHGLNPSFCIYDELHAANSGDLYNVMKSGSNARRQPLIAAITTAGTDRRSFCYSRYSYAKRVLSGDITDPAFYAYIREPDPEDNWKDRAVWEKVNPGWGISVKPDAFEALFRQAAAIPSEQNTFRQLYLNEWVSGSKRWLSLDTWDAGETDARPEDFPDAEFFGGLDLSTTQDLTAFVLACRAGDHAYIFPYFFLPEDTAEADGINRAFYFDARKNGFLNVTLGNVIDYNYIVDFIRGLRDRGIRINSIAFDPWNSSAPVLALSEDFEMVKYPQNFSTISPAAKDFERALLNGSLLHARNPVLRWNADSVEIASDRNGNIKPVKSGPDNKIDGIIAGIMAFDLLSKNYDLSVYEDRGVISI